MLPHVIVWCVVSSAQKNMLPPVVVWYVVTSAWKEHASTCEPSTEKNGF